jgi:cytochrome c oxidase assembly protein subunit 15
VTITGAAADSRAIGRWLAVWAAAVALLVLIGGATRLTESGLSITEWKPLTGVMPPLSTHAWEEEFARYRLIPQYQQLHADMTLAQFRAIYLWEYAHRLWARLVGVAFALPFMWFGLRRRVPATVLPRLAVLLALLGLQGAMGWWMVQSGLSVRTSVSQYRLAAHLMMALVIYAAAVWTAAGLLEPRAERGDAERSSFVAMLALTALAFLTALSGAFVAGLHAGKIYNSVPFMGAGFVPAEYLQLSPAWRNVFENPAAAQFDHRVLATVTFVAVMIAGLVFGRGGNARLAGRARWFLAAALLQVALGIATLLGGVPVVLGVAHQAGAVLLLTAGILALHATPRRLTALPASPSSTPRA